MVTKMRYRLHNLRRELVLLMDAACFLFEVINLRFSALILKS